MVEKKKEWGILTKKYQHKILTVIAGGGLHGLLFLVIKSMIKSYAYLKKI